MAIVLPAKTIDQISDRLRHLNQVANFEALSAIAHSRTQLRVRMRSIASDAQLCVGKLPPTTRTSDKINIPTNMRKIVRAANSIAEGLVDRAISRRQAVALAAEIPPHINYSLDLLQRLIVQPRPESETAPATAAAPRNRNKVLTDLKDLDRYDGFLREIRSKVDILNRTGRLDDGNTATEPPPMDTGPIQHADNSSYIARETQDSERMTHMLTDAVSKMPEIRPLGNRLYDRVRAPIVAVSQYTLPRKLLHRIRIDSATLYIGQGTPYTPGIGGRDKLISPTLLYNQWILMMPLAVAMDRDEFPNALAINIDAISQHIGDMVPMPVTPSTILSSPTSGNRNVSEREVEKYLELQQQQLGRGDATPQFHLDKWNPPSLRVLLTERRQKVKEAVEKFSIKFSKTNPKAKPDAIKSAAQEESKRLTKKFVPDEKQRLVILRKMYDKLTQEQRDAIRESQIDPQLQKAKQVQNKRMGAIDRTRRLYFTDRRFPKVAFIWLVNKDQYAELHRSVIFQVTFPEIREPVLQTANKPETTSVNQELMRKVMGDLRTEIDKLDRNIIAAKNRLTKLEAEQREQKSILEKIPNQKSPQYRAASAALEVTNNKVAQVQGGIPAIRTRIRWMQEEIVRRAAQFAEERKAAVQRK